MKIIDNLKYHWQLYLIITIFTITVPKVTLAQATDTETTPGLLGAIDNIFSQLVAILGKVLFLEIAGFPLIVLWLICGSIFFTLRMGFINIRGLKHSLDIVQGKYDDPHDDGEVSHFQALATALSGTVGLGNIAGVAIAVQAGGPGAVLWMTLGGFFGMSRRVEENVAISPLSSETVRKSFPLHGYSKVLLFVFLTGFKVFISN